MNKLHISYKNNTLEPPYTYAVVLDFTFNNDKIDCSFSLMYIDREDFSEQELATYDFSKNDDFEWKGTISNNWLEDLNVFNLNSLLEDSNDEVYLYIEIDENKKGFSPTPQIHELIIQQIMQAIYEEANVEAPLIINTSIPDLTLNWHFSTKTFLVNKKKSDWKIGQELLAEIYKMDDENLKIENKKPNKMSLNFGSNEWFLIENKDLKRKIIQLSK